MTALSIKDLTKTYPGGTTALKGINLDVPEGDFFALLGPNGAGKSTAIGITSSLVNKTSGSVHIFGHNIETEIQQAKANLGLVPQEFNFNGFEAIFDTLTNVAGYNGIPLREGKKRAEHYLKRLDLWDKRHSAGRQLSGGMKRRLMIARALVHEPKLLILDEPTAGVDIEIRRSMWEYLSEINTQQGISIILTTHYLEEAEALCRNVAIIDKGEIVEQGEVSQLLSQSMLETFVLDLQSALTEVPDLGPYAARLRKDDKQLEVDVPKGHSVNDLFAQLSQQTIQVASMRNKSNRLEEFFMRLVHQEKASDTDAEQAVPYGTMSANQGASK